MFKLSSKSIKPCNKVMRISEHFHLKDFIYRTFLYVVFQSIFRGALRTALKHLRLNFYKNRQQMLPASIINA